MTSWVKLKVSHTGKLNLTTALPKIRIQNVYEDKKDTNGRQDPRDQEPSPHFQPL